MATTSGGAYSFKYHNCGVGYTYYSAPVFISTFDDYKSVKRIRPPAHELKFNLTTLGRYRSRLTDKIVFVKQSCCSSCIPSQDYTPFSIRGSVGLPVTAVPDKDYANVFRSRLLSKIKGQKVNLAMTLATYRQTASMFVQGASAFLDLVRSLRGLRVPRKALRMWNHLSKRQKRAVSLALPAEWTTKNLANTWLIAQFGIKPLLSDLQGSLLLLDEGLAKPLSFEVRSRFPEKYSTTSTRGPAGTSPYRFYGTQVDDIEKVYRGKAFVELNPSDAALLTAQGLGFTNPAFLLWDYTPLSFVFDYFIDVGSWLDNLDALVGVSRVAAYYSCRTKVKTSVTVDGVSAFSSYESYNRTRLTLDNPLPQFEPSLSKTRVATLVALLRQQGAVHRIR